MHYLAFIGTQGEGPGEGIVAIHVDQNTGAMTNLGTVAEEERPTWTLPDPQKPVLYAVSEVGNRDERCGAIMSYRIADARGTLRPITRRRTSGGPTHLDMSTSGEMLYCANFGGPQAVAVRVGTDGFLDSISDVVTTTGTGPHRRQKVPHPHGVTIDPSGRFLLVPDMGADRIFVYEIDAQNLRPAKIPFLQLPAGCGPRFVLFGADGRFAYMVAELSGQVFQLGWNGEIGKCSILGHVNLDAPDATYEPGAAAFGLSADGRFLYISNRATNEICTFAIASETGALSLKQVLASGGEKPWGLGLSPCGKWMLVANQASNNVSIFQVDVQSGLLKKLEASLEIRTPTSAAFVPVAVLSSFT